MELCSQMNQIIFDDWMEHENEQNTKKKKRKKWGWGLKEVSKNYKYKKPFFFFFFVLHWFLTIDNPIGPDFNYLCQKW